MDKELVERLAEEGVTLTPVDGKKVKLTPTEKKAIARIEAQGTKVEDVYRRSPREFDLHLEGTEQSAHFKDMEPIRFSSWLPLHAIREFLLWTHPEIACMTDYANMAHEGDWSGIRDSSPEAIWEIFERYGKDALFGKGKLYHPSR